MTKHQTLHLVQEYSSKAPLEKACLEEVGCHFTQVTLTPFLQEPLISIFSKMGSKLQEFDKV